MFQIEENASVTHLNTLRLHSQARYLVTVDTEEALVSVLQGELARDYPVFILSGGSNVLLGERLDALIVQPALKGIQQLRQDAAHVWVEVMAGEDWHGFVQYALAQGWYGLENLSLIPGWVGAAPIQNIGAYGVEVGQYIDCVRAWHIPDAKWHWLTAAQCGFGYRDSVFKQQAGDWVISRVVFKLTRQPNLILSYGDVRQLAGPSPTPQRVAQAVIAIRQDKLPNPQHIANAGSFFKNPLITASQFEQLKANYPQLTGYQQADGQMKVPAGWLIEQAGWKGKNLGPVGMYAKQALVLVNHAQARLPDVQRLSQAVQQDVAAQFGIGLTQEPVVVHWCSRIN